jgi:hypothetical protein
MHSTQMMYNLEDGRICSQPENAFFRVRNCTLPVTSGKPRKKIRTGFGILRQHNRWNNTNMDYYVSLPGKRMENHN